MVCEGWNAVTLALGGVIVLIATLTVVQVHQAICDLRRQSDMIRRAATEAEQHYVEVLWRIVRFVEARHKYTRGHSERVAALSEQIARKMGLPVQRCDELRMAGRLHDLGMIAVPQKIVNGRDRIGADSFRIVKKHPEAAYEILKPLKSLSGALPAVLAHHERMNGTGYPSGLGGTEIPIEARILAVADAYDAMTHDRPYRAAMSPLTALEELRRCAPAGYDPDCVAALAELKNLPELKQLIARA